MLFCASGTVSSSVARAGAAVPGSGSAVPDKSVSLGNSVCDDGCSHDHAHVMGKLENADPAMVNTLVDGHSRPGLLERHTLKGCASTRL